MRLFRGLSAAMGMALIAGTVLVTGAPASGYGPAGDWPQPGHNAAHNNANTTEWHLTSTNITKVRRLRQLSATAYAEYSVVAGGVLYAARNGAVTATQIKTGRLLWSWTVGERFTGLAVANNRVIVAWFRDDPKYAGLDALDAATGQDWWGEGAMP